MPRFYLLEPSLRAVGGHYYEYAFQILTAAESAGFSPLLVTHQRLPNDTGFPSHWPIVRAFPHIVGGIHRVPQESHAGARRSIGSILRQAIDWSKARFGHLRFFRNRTRIQGFATACQQLFMMQPVGPGDIILCATATDTELLGLGHYLRTDPQSRVADWHLQFHFRLLRGRDPDFIQQQPQLNRLKLRLQRVLMDLTHHHLHFHTTNAPLSRQFRHLGLFAVDELPWPVGPRFGELANDGNAKPSRCDTRSSLAEQPRLRVLLAGSTRAEKGSDLLQAVLQQLDRSSLLRNRIQLVIQEPTQTRDRLPGMLGANKGVTIQRCEDVASLDRADAFQAAAIVIVPHPLSAENYAHLIRSAHIGLLPYDPHEYFARCSGVLLEFLAAGVPVVGSAACWLGDQIEGANQSYLQQWTRQESTRALEESRPENGWPVIAQRSIQLGDEAFALPLSCADSPSDLLIRIQGLEFAEPGTYVRLTLRARIGLSESPVLLASHVLGYAVPCDSDSTIRDYSDARPVTAAQALHVLFPFDVFSDNATPPNNPVSVQLEIAPYAPGQRSLPLSLVVFSADAKREHVPRGSVGLTIPSASEIAEALQEMVAHYEHYARCAKDAAPSWQRRHSPHETILRLRRGRT